MPIKRIILAPHADDDVLGCGGIIDKNTYVIYCGIDEKKILDSGDTWVKSRPQYSARIQEIRTVADILGNGYLILDNSVNHYDLSNLISHFEREINKRQPLEVYIPHPSYNQDHRTVYDAAMVALRPHDINYFVQRVLIYEQPHMLFWKHGQDFEPNYFVPIDIEKKLAAYVAMSSQVRSFRSPEHVRAIAKLRGGQSNCEYAEAFKILRWVGV